jgi:transposase
MIKRFSNNLSVTKIRRKFVTAKFGKRTVCPYCNYYRKLYRLQDERRRCKRCSRKFSITTNTYLAKSRLSLDQWYELLWWFVYEFTANKTSKEINLSQKLVHRSFSLIRKAIYDYELQEMIQFFGTIEVDETYIGPKFRNRRKKNRDKYRKLNVVKRGRGVKDLQQPIFGIYQRNGKIYIEFVKKVDKKTLHDIIKGRVVLDSKIYSDNWKSYKGLKKKGYHHHTVDHGKEEYVRQINNSKAHINGIEGFWGYLKERLLKHHGVADKNLIFYVKEIEFRFNNRHLPTEQLMQKIIQILLSKKLIYLKEILLKTKLSEPVKFQFKQQILLRNLVKIGPPDD